MGVQCVNHAWFIFATSQTRVCVKCNKTEPCSILPIPENMHGEHYTLLQKINALEKRIKVLEDKKPRYVPPTVYGPIKKRRKII